MQKIAKTRITLQSSAMSRKPIAVQAASPIAEGGRRRLQFLSSFMSTVGGSGADVARVVGKTRACVSNWFRADDTRLSYCYDYISSKGYRLEVSLEGMETVYEDDGVSIIIEKRTLASGERECVRLAFLKEAMARTGITKRAVAVAVLILLMPALTPNTMASSPMAITQNAHELLANHWR